MDKIKVIFWDWNGTLWDDVDQWFIAARAAYAHAQISEELTLEKLRDVFDVPVRDVIYSLGAPHDLAQEHHDNLLQTFTETLAQFEHLSKARAGASEALRSSETLGIVNRLVSNHPLPLLEKELKQAGLTSFFGTVCGNNHHDQVYTQPTKRDRIQKHLQDLGFIGSQAAIVADTREEIRIAREFGMVSVAITGGYNSERVLQAEQPDILIHDLRDIRGVLAP